MNADLKNLLDLVSSRLEDKTDMLVAADCAAENGLPCLEGVLRYFATEWTGPKPLFTGSRRYGKPKPDSDWDWVVRMSAGPKWKESNRWPFKSCREWPKDTQELIDISGTELSAEDYEPEANGSNSRRLDLTLRFGPLNLILVHRDIQWNTWFDGTHQLCDEAYKLAPDDEWGEQAVYEGVSRERAIEVFQETFVNKAREQLAQITGP